MRFVSVQTGIAGVAQQLVAAEYHQDRAVRNWVWSLFLTHTYVGDGLAGGFTRGSRQVMGLGVFGGFMS